MTAAKAAGKAPPRIRRATLADLPAIQELEAASFQEYRRASPASLRRSLASSAAGGRQSVWVMDCPGGVAGLLVLWHFQRRLRVYDIATHPEARGQGIGSRLLEHAVRLARDAGVRDVSLEAEEQDGRLVAWYEKAGFVQVARLADFYHAGCSAVRMRKRL